MILSNYLLINFFEIAAFQKNISNGKTCMISVRFASLKNEMHYFLRKSHTLWGILHAHYIFLTMWTGLSSKKGLYFQIIVHRVILGPSLCGMTASPRHGTIPLSNLSISFTFHSMPANLPLLFCTASSFGFGFYWHHAF
jgi:hypothetical protein